MAASFDPCVLRAWRQESGLKAEQVCVLADVSYPYLKGLEGGAYRNPSAALLTRLANTFGRSVGELFPDADAAGVR